MNGDPNQTSTKLRNAAVEVIKEKKRPLASHKIETWIRENDKQLSDLISSKCSDYVRIILSVTQDNCIVKYKSLQPVPGVDKRSTFYGLADANYSPSEWTLLGSKPIKNKKAAPKKLPPPVIVQPKSIVASPVIEFPDLENTYSSGYNEELLVFDDLMDEFHIEGIQPQIFLENLFE